MQADDLWKLPYSPQVPQIFEGISRIQRMVIARDLKGASDR
jgi:hypothetical protein